MTTAGRTGPSLGVTDAEERRREIKQVGYNPTTREVELLLEGNTLLDIEVSEDRQVLFPSEIVTDERGYRVIKPVKRKEYTLRLTIE